MGVTSTLGVEPPVRLDLGFGPECFDSGRVSWEPWRAYERGSVPGLSQTPDLGRQLDGIALRTPL